MGMIPSSDSLRNSQHTSEQKDLLLCPGGPITGYYPERDESSPHTTPPPQIFFSKIYPSLLGTKMII